MTSVFNSFRLFWRPSPTLKDTTHTHSRPSLMSCVAPCTCTTKICLGDETQASLVCAICKSSGKLTVCDTNSDGFVCGMKLRFHRNCVYAVEDEKIPGPSGFGSKHNNPAGVIRNSELQGNLAHKKQRITGEPRS